ncbi:cadherin-like domain-containing protein [Synechococcus sp. WH 7805]|uniref:cadherin-like domain-containing protein n=1 Tax=Synechococcus sp. (strain WH7805) TaxID=59931 RepID=UPI000322198D|nr:cadherin-like domain-containing protein [Synechococcus sp. WH 7805]
MSTITEAETMETNTGSNDGTHAIPDAATLENDLIEVANSVTEFSATQGENNWYYGYYNGGELNQNNFHQFQNYNNNGTFWDIDSTYYTRLRPDGGHPHGPISTKPTSGIVHWTVRRWIAESSGEFQITGIFDDTNKGGGGDGVEGFITVNGEIVYSQIATNSTAAYNYNVHIQLSQGDVVDFVTSPRTWDGDDDFKFTASIAKSVNTNTAPALTRTVATLPDGKEDVPYILKTSDLLQGYTDADGDTLSVTELRTSVGYFTNNDDGTWTLTTPQNFNGSVEFSYSVTDGNGAYTPAYQTFSLTPVNDAPIVPGAVDLGSTPEDTSFLITSEQLLANASDPDGDALSISNLKLIEGQGSITENADGTWTFSPAGNFNGDVSFSYTVSDGESTPVSEQWLRYGGTSGNDYSGGLAIFSNGDLAHAVSSQNDNGSSTVTVQRVTTSGQVVWSLDINADYAPSAGQILVNGDDTVFITGGTKTGASGESGKNDSDVYATAISTNGNQLWYKNYGIGIHEIGATAALDANGNLLINGRISEVNDAYTFIKDVPNFYGADFTGGWKGFQLKLNPENGTIRQAYTTGSYNSGGNQIVSDQSRNIAYINGYTFGSVNGVGTIGNGDTAGANNYLIARDETTGATIWTRMENWIRSNIVVIEEEDGLYFIDKGNLEKIQGSTGKSLWSKPIANNHYRLGKAANGGILLSQASSNGTLEIQAVSSDGNFGITQVIDHQGTLYPREILETNNGQLIISGSTTGALQVGEDVKVLTSQIGSNDAFTLKIKSNFSAGTSAATVQTGEVTTAMADLTVTPVNDAPELTGTPASLPNGKEDIPYTLKASDLLQGYTDVDGDTLSVTNLTTSVGYFTNNDDGTWTLTTPQNFNGTVDISYSVSDGNGAYTSAYQSFSLTPVNDAPELTGTPASLSNGKEDVPYILKASDLLQGYTDADDDTLSVTDLTTSVGYFTNNDDGTWTLTTPQNFNGTVDISYSVSDGNGAYTSAYQSFSLTPVNDAPIVSGAVDLGSTPEDTNFLITSEQLLANASDIDGDELFITDLDLSKGAGELITNPNGGWVFTPTKDWNGEVEFSYSISDSGGGESYKINDKVFLRGSSLYTIVDGPSWTSAETNAKKLGGHLTQINDQYENDWIYSNLILATNIQDTYEGAYIGLTKSDETRTWGWSNGVPSNYFNWAEGTPNGEYVPENYGVINIEGFWDDWTNQQGNISKGIAEIPFIRRGDSAYVVVQGPTWEEAEANAQKLGGHLVTINDAEENDWILNTFRKDFTNGAGFIGYSDTKIEGQWIWSSGEATTYTNWDAGNPSNSGGLENVGTIQFGDGSWNDVATNYWNWFGQKGEIKGIAEIKLGSDFGVKTSASLTVTQVNDAPELTGTPASLPNGKEDIPYILKVSDLLQGYTDADSDMLSVTDLTTSVGYFTNNVDGTWTLTTPQNFNGTVDLTYFVSDGNGAYTPAYQSFSLTPVNDAPIVSGAVDLGSTPEDTSFLITSEQLLANASDPDGDSLSISNLKLIEGQGSITDNGDGTWTFSPDANWNGDASFSYGVSDGKSTPVSEQWLRYDGTSGNDYSGGLATFSNGDLAHAVSSQNGNGSSTVTVQRLTNSGQVVWSLDINADYAPGAGQILVNGDDTVFIAGGTKTGASGESGKNDSDVYATAISANGNQLWYKNYGIGIHEIGATAALDANGNLLIHGRVSEVNDAYTFIKDVPNFYGADFTGGWKGFQLKLNPEDGTIRQAYTTGSGNSGGNQIVSDQSRNIAYIDGYTFGSVNGVGTIGNGDTAGANNYLIARDETTGATIWTRMENWIRSNIIVDEEEDALYFIDKGNLEKIQGSTGKSLWSKPVANKHYRLGRAANGGILLSQASSNGTLEIQAVSSDGNFGITQVIDHQGTLYPREILENNNGQLIISGSTTGALQVGEDVKVLTSQIGSNDAFTLKIKSNLSTGNSAATVQTGTVITALAGLTVTPVNNAPELTGTPASLSNGKEDVPYILKASDLLQGYTDVDGDTLSVTNLTTSVGYFTNNDDGTWTLTTPQNFNGNVDLSYSVTDGNGAYTPAYQSFSLTPINDAPELTGTPASLSNGKEDVPYILKASNLLQGYTDADDDTLSVTDLTTSVGYFTNNDDGTWTLTTPQNFNGTVDISYSVSDGNGAYTSAYQSFSLTPVNDAPELTGTPASLSNGKEDVPYILKASDLLQGYTDADDDTLSVTDLTTSVGYFTNNDDGTWTLTTPQNFNGTVDISYSVSDGNGAYTSAYQSFSLTPVNDAPIVSGAVDLGSTPEDTSFLITSEQLLANASDVDGDELFITDLDLSKGAGELNANPDKSWIFTPTKDWNGEVEFSYSISDNGGGENYKINDKVFLRGNSLYTIVDGPSWTSAETNAKKLGGHLTQINDQYENDWIYSNLILATNIQDTYEGAYIGLTKSDEARTWGWSNGVPSNYFNWAEGTPNGEYVPENYGVINIEGFWDDWTNQQGNISKGIAEIPFIRRGDSAYVIVEGPTWKDAQENAEKLGGNLVTINDAEENYWLATNSYFESPGNFVFYGIGLTDEEKEGDWAWKDASKSTFRSWDQSNGDGLPEPNSPNDGISNYAYIGRGFNNDSLYKTETSGLEEGSWYDDGNRPSPAFNGIKVFGIAEIKLGSDFGVKTSASLSINPINDAPVLSGTAATLPNGKEDIPYTLKASDLLQGYTDVDGDTLSVNDLTTSIGYFTNNDDGTRTLTTPQNFNGNVDLSYSVTDGNGAYTPAYQSFSLTPVNDAPELTGTPASLPNGKEDIPYILKASDLLQGYTDVDGDTLSVTDITASVGYFTNNNDGNWTFTPGANFNGEVSFSYTVSDGSLTTDATASLNVAAVNDAPVLSGTPVELPNGTEDVAYVLKASDLLKGYSDIEGDALSITSVSTASANGTITDNGDGTWTYTPTQDLNGEVVFSFVVSDGNGGTANGSTSLTLDPVEDEVLLDEDNNGIVDGTELTAYQLFSEAGAITLKNNAGQTYNNSSSGNSDVVAAIETDNGFQVLLEGTGSRNDTFYVWNTNSNGVIIGGSGWKSGDIATRLGWEETFNFDTNRDGTIGALILDDDNNGIVDGTELTAYQLFSEAGAITLKNNAGQTYNNSSSGNSDVVAAIETDNGFQVLLEGTGSRNDTFYVWNTNSNGVIIGGSGWKSGDIATRLGWEETFNFDTNRDGTIGALILDDDNNGIVDGTELTAYQLFSEAGAITLKNNAGQTYNNSSSGNSDVVAAIETDNGFQVLLEGTGSRNDTFYVWDTNSNGVITGGSGWKSGNIATRLGWEETFNFDTNRDGTIGALILDDDNNGIVDGTELTAYQLFSEAGAITLKNNAGQTYNNSSSGNSDVVAAIETDNGFQVLLEGTGSRNDTFYVWDTNSNGVITGGSGWKSGNIATRLGWEETFNFDTNRDGTIGALILDDDNNGIVDGTELTAYQLFSEAGAITLKNNAGQTYNNSSSGNSDVVAAIETDNGFQVLLEGTGSRNDTFYVWNTNSNGVITGGSGWKSGDIATRLGWEETFNFDTNADGIIGNEIKDEDQNGLVDNVTNYQLFSESGAITLQNNKGGTYSDSTTNRWDAIAAAQVDGGFKVLLEGTNDALRDQYLVWTTDFNGTIIDSTGFQPGDELADQGFEELFAVDLNADGFI